jgi:hypothetical protein
MPEISRFYGIVVQMYFGDHTPPHFHARYAGHTAKVDINSLAVIGIWYEITSRFHPVCGIAR